MSRKQSRHSNHSSGKRKQTDERLIVEPSPNQNSPIDKLLSFHESAVNNLAKKTSGSLKEVFVKISQQDRQKIVDSAKEILRESPEESRMNNGDKTGIQKIKTFALFGANNIADKHKSHMETLASHFKKPKKNLVGSINAFFAEGAKKLVQTQNTHMQVFKDKIKARTIDQPVIDYKTLQVKIKKSTPSKKESKQISQLKQSLNHYVQEEKVENRRNNKNQNIEEYSPKTNKQQLNLNTFQQKRFGKSVKLRAKDTIQPKKEELSPIRLFKASKVVNPQVDSKLNYRMTFNNVSKFREYKQDDKLQANIDFLMTLKQENRKSLIKKQRQPSLKHLQPLNNAFNHTYRETYYNSNNLIPIMTTELKNSAKEKTFVIRPKPYSVYNPTPRTQAFKLNFLL